MPQRFDFDSLASIHHRPLGDVVVGRWVGRTLHSAAPMGVLNTGIVYARGKYVPSGLDDVFG